jgi:integrase
VAGIIQRNARFSPLAGCLRPAEETTKKKIGPVLPFIFLNENGIDRVKQFDKAWKTACKNAGIALKLFHGFRKTAVRNMARAGIPERVAMMIVEHRTRSVLGPSNILSEAGLRMAAQEQQEYSDLQPTGTTVNLKTHKTSVRL